MALSKPSSKEELAKFEIKELEELEGGKCSGSGSFGTVFKVKVDGVARIAKRLHNVLIAPDIRPEDKDGIRERFYNECLLLSKLDHPCIVQFVGVHFHGPNRSDVTLVMECLHTDLDRFLDPKERPNIPLSIKLSILLDVSAGLLYLHHQLEEPLVHRDLKAENILITNDVRAKIADLGVSKLLKNYPHHSTIQTKCPGTLAYMPPEALCEDPQYDTSLDIFSFGQLALYTAIQEFPQVFNMVRDPKMTSAIRLGESEILRRKKWIDLLGEHHCLSGIILQCLKDDSTNRPKTQELKITMKTLCVIHPKSLADVFSTVEEKADVIELNRKNAQLTSEKAQMEQALASKVKDVHALKLELERMELLIKEKQQLQDQVEALQVQMMENKMNSTAGMVREKEKQLHELGEDYARVVDERDQVLKSLQSMATLSAQLSDSEQLNTVFEIQVNELNNQLESANAKVSTAMESLKVMAEEMDKDRKRAFELQGKLDKFRKGATPKGKRVYLPDPCEAAEKRVAKLEELYNNAVTEIQSLTVEKKELTKQVGELLREKRVCPLQHGSSQATTPIMVNAFQQEIIEKEMIHAQLRNELEHSQAEKRRMEERLIDKDHQIKELETKFEAANSEVKTHFTRLHSLPSDNSWNFQRKEVVIKEEIGRGASGLVSKGQFRGQTVAVKQIHGNILTQKHVMDEFKREVKIMAGIQHPNLVRFVGAVFDQNVENFTDTPLLLLELLHTNLRQGYERSNISLGVSVSIFHDVAYGLHYLHEHQEPIIHRDVSAPNVLLEALPGGMWRAKLSDFGSANFLKRSLTLGTGAIVYTAPEMFPREDPSAPVPRPTTKCDVFSYGIVLVEVITKTMPSLENRHELFAQVQRKWQMMHDLISQCTQLHPQNRPTMLAVLNTLNKIPVARPR